MVSSQLQCDAELFVAGARSRPGFLVGLVRRRSAAPPHVGPDDLLLNAISLVFDAVRHADQENLRKQMRNQSQVDKLLMTGVVVMLFSLDPRIFQMFDLNRKT